jgi:hypothetical protein
LIGSIVRFFILSLGGAAKVSRSSATCCFGQPPFPPLTWLLPPFLLSESQNEDACNGELHLPMLEPSHHPPSSTSAPCLAIIQSSPSPLGASSQQQLQTCHHRAQETACKTRLAFHRRR